MRSRVRLALVGALACAGALACVKQAPEPSATPEAQPAADAGFGPWQATLAVDHPLVGTAWSTREQRVITRAELETQLRAATFVLLGETHDHPDHHRLQGELIAALIQRDSGDGSGPAVAYEMLDPQLQAQIDAFVAGDASDPDAFAQLVDWEHSGWPAWALYRPAFAPALAADLPILAAQFPRSASKRFMAEGLAVVDPQTVSRYQLDQPLEPAIAGPWLDEMFVSHCEMVPREQLAPMVEIQRIRDAVMADALLRGAELRKQAVLVAGTGHTRDVGVPRLLRMTGVDDAAILSVGFVSVDLSQADASAYGAEHDVIVFTPGIEREDPCAAMSGG